jgi:hypothetical protein
MVTPVVSTSMMSDFAAVPDRRHGVEGGVEQVGVGHFLLALRVHVRSGQERGRGELQKSGGVSFG